MEGEPIEGNVQNVGRHVSRWCDGLRQERSQWRGRCHQRRHGAYRALHELLQHLRPAFLGSLLAVVAATVRRLVRVQRQQHLRAGKAVPQEQRHNHQRRQGSCRKRPHRNSIVSIGRREKQRIFRLYWLKYAYGASGGPNPRHTWRTGRLGAGCQADTLKTVDRLYSRSELLQHRALWREQGKRVVFTNGCYDLLHPGHIRLLEQARSLGDVLILALNSDASVRRFKGPSRPLLSEEERAELAAALEAVDAATIFDEDTPRELIAAVLPDVLVKGADWSHFIAGKEEVEAAGGQVLTLPLEPGYSTTNLVELLAKQP